MIGILVQLTLNAPVCDYLILHDPIGGRNGRIDKEVSFTALGVQSIDQIGPQIQGQFIPQYQYAGCNPGLQMTVVDLTSIGGIVQGCILKVAAHRSEERRVGEEWRSWWGAYP